MLFQPASYQHSVLRRGGSHDAPERVREDVGVVAVVEAPLQFFEVPGPTERPPRERTVTPAWSQDESGRGGTTERFRRTGMAHGIPLPNAQRVITGVTEVVSENL